MSAVAYIHNDSNSFNVCLNYYQKRRGNLACKYTQQKSAKIRVIVVVIISVFKMIYFLFFFLQILFLPIVLYVPALAFNQVTGANIYIISCIVCAVCVFYTFVGGIKVAQHFCWMFFLIQEIFHFFIFVFFFLILNFQKLIVNVFSSTFQF